MTALRAGTERSNVWALAKANSKSYAVEQANLLLGLESENLLPNNGRIE